LHGKDSTACTKPALPQTPHRAGALYTGYTLFLLHGKASGGKEQLNKCHLLKKKKIMLHFKWKKTVINKNFL